jgi:hypothetical protein
MLIMYSTTLYRMLGRMSIKNHSLNQTSKVSLEYCTALGLSPHPPPLCLAFPKPPEELKELPQTVPPTPLEMPVKNGVIIFFRLNILQ